MTEEQNGYWFCPFCKEEVNWYHVSYEELHEICGYPVKWIDLEAIKELKYVEAKIPENPHQKTRDFRNELGLPEETINPNWEAYNQAILDIKEANPNGLYTKEANK